jgi:hypothetical protein
MRVRFRAFSTQSSQFRVGVGVEAPRGDPESRASDYSINCPPFTSIVSPTT